MNSLMQHHDTDENDSGMGPSAMRHARLIFYGFAIIAAVLLLIEHRAHLLPFLPWLFLAACPLMHLFMHRGHHGHGHGDTGTKQSDDRRPSERPPVNESGRMP